MIFSTPEWLHLSGNHSGAVFQNLLWRGGVAGFAGGFELVAGEPFDGLGCSWLTSRGESEAASLRCTKIHSGWYHRGLVVVVCHASPPPGHGQASSWPEELPWSTGKRNATRASEKWSSGSSVLRGGGIGQESEIEGLGNRLHCRPEVDALGSSGLRRGNAMGRSMS